MNPSKTKIKKGRFTMKRDFMKSYFGTPIETDQQKEIPQPPLQKPYGKDEEIIDLPKVDKSIIIKDDIFQIILDPKLQ